MTISPFVAICTLIVFFASLFVAPFHFEGDQLYYNAAYDAVAGLPLLAAYEEYRYYIDSAEFVHFIVIWFGSNLGIDKNLLMSGSNAALAYAVLKLFRQWRVLDWLAAVFVFSNFYILVLYFTTERLKFSFIFLVLSLLSVKHLRVSFLLAASSILAHVQNLIIYFSAILSMGSRSLSRFRFLRLHQLLPFVFVASIVFVYGDTLLLHIQAKVAIYSSNNEKPFLQDVAILALLFLASIRYGYSKINVVVVFLPLFPILFVLGSDRVNMIGYLFFVYFAFRHNRGLNAAVLATSAYLFWKGGYYLYWLFETGNGFGY